MWSTSSIVSISLIRDWGIQRTGKPHTGSTWNAKKEVCGVALLKGNLGSFCFSSLPAPLAQAGSARMCPLKRSFLCPVLQVLGLLGSVRTESVSVLYAQLLWTKSIVMYSAAASGWGRINPKAPKLTAYRHLCLSIMFFNAFLSWRSR